jgi:hypothetical protein
MDDIIEALNIFRKYMESEYEIGYPTHCEHDVLFINCDKKDIPEEDVKRLEELGFIWMSGDDCWGSFRFGSC